MKKILFALILFCLPSLTFADPLALQLFDGKIFWDTHNERYVEGCWNQDAPTMFYYTNTEGKKLFAEICNEPDETTFGKGETVEERAKNYYDFLTQKSEEIRLGSPGIKIVLGSLSGFNEDFLYTFLQLPNSCELFDIYSYHPYHAGVSPDEIDTKKNSWHTVEQWTNMSRDILKEKNCEKPIWTTEFGYTTENIDAEYSVSSQDQINFAIKQTLIMVGNGVERVEYFSGKSFKFSDKNREKYKSFLRMLSGSTLVKVEYFGENYCPRGISAGCFSTNKGRKYSGLPKNKYEMQKGRKYTFEKDGKYFAYYWQIGMEEIFLEEDIVFLDIKKDHRFFEAIEFIKEKKYVNGYQDGTFREKNFITRAEFTKIIVASKFSPEEITNCEIPEENFSDISPDDWFTPYICIAKRQEIINGYPDNTFKPNAPIGFLEAMKVIISANNIEVIQDENQQWYEPYMQWAWRNGLTNTIQENNGCSEENCSLEITLHQISRGEMAHLIFSVMK